MEGPTHDPPRQLAQPALEAVGSSFPYSCACSSQASGHRPVLGTALCWALPCVGPPCIGPCIGHHPVLGTAVCWAPPCVGHRALCWARSSVGGCALQSLRHCQRGRASTDLLDEQRVNIQVLQVGAGHHGGKLHVADVLVAQQLQPPQLRDTQGAVGQGTCAARADVHATLGAGVRATIGAGVHATLRAHRASPPAAQAAAAARHTGHNLGISWRLWKRVLIRMHAASVHLPLIRHASPRGLVHTHTYAFAAFDIVG